LAAARLARTAFAGLPAWCRPADEDEAYAAQEALHGRLTAAGLGPVTAAKIGCTTPVMQKYLAIPNPCAGGIFASTVCEGTARCRAGNHVRLGVECEIAVRLKQDLSGPSVSRAAAADAVGTCLAAIELVDDRYADYRALDTPTLIVEDFFNAGCVLREEIADFRADRLDTVTGVLTVNDAVAGRGSGRDVLGHPLESLRWLAESRARRGRPLRAGMVVLLGSVVQTRWMGLGDRAHAQVDPLGEVSAVLAG
jgi:2-oxo-3-hexenedioate decarboxylase/2-keto-4-pentenoate hydratase